MRLHKRCFRTGKKIGSKNIIFSGGEPLLHPKFYKSLEYGFNRGFEIPVTSNGTFIDEECVNKLKSVDAKVTISIDGSSPKINDSLRGAGTFKKAINAVESLVDSNIYTSMRMTLLKSNLGDLRNYIVQDCL
ncbi:radical SAM protein [Methanothermobacter thermautotrophicus]|nr:radical SAM protein [Methanothermobacter thermautotrophicus]